VLRGGVSGIQMKRRKLVLAVLGSAAVVASETHAIDNDARVRCDARVGIACGYDEDDDSDEDAASRAETARRARSAEKVGSSSSGEFDQACARRVRAQCGKELSDKDGATKLCEDLARFVVAHQTSSDVETCVKKMQKDAQDIYEANK
jgi:hypothetical protein